MSFLSKLKILILSSFLVFVGGALILNYSVTENAKAQSVNRAITGYAWSDNIGWIQFDAGSDPVVIDVNGNLKGFAWSDNIGWVKFDQNLTGPSGNESGVKVTFSDPQKNNGTVYGWARACGGTVNGDCLSASRTDGWDGWIKFGGNSSNNPVLENNVFKGFVWGSDVVGWVKLDTAVQPVSIVDSTITTTLTVNGSTVPSSVWKSDVDDGGVQVSWQSSKTGGSYSCSLEVNGNEISTDKNGTKTEGLPSSGTALQNLTIPSNTFYLVCTDGSLTSEKTVNLTILDDTVTPSYSCINIPADSQACGTSDDNSSFTENINSLLYSSCAGAIDDIDPSGFFACSYECKTGYVKIGDICRKKGVIIEQ